ncbi:MarR family winged helix-turn-helix transcriptional regulator [Symbioplanes lichenis]|uniref:MarR family winged helix-turn-helix transcriptional regulator n=1 Tax=Symbioplanes lichenis TaxID=1629072 RepID=UPI002738727B|nr:MarR family winged helix-turn-helix transcriptional regulator [Actinoplanes lichenis]
MTLPSAAQPTTVATTGESNASSDTRTADSRPLGAPPDRRGIHVRLTDVGLAVVDRAVAAGLDAQRDLLAHLTPRRRDQLAGLLRTALNGNGPTPPA